MQLFKDVEVLYSDLYVKKPHRTFNINTTAPITQSYVPPPSAGVATLALSESYTDRFIVWRANGQKLFLEERSICRTVLYGSLCIDFGRTSVIPGTHITIEKFILCLVVPTQSGVHRFVARIRPETLDEFNVEVNSLFCQINEKEFIGENHYTVLLATSGDPLKAHVVTNVMTTRVMYCMMDGQIVLMSFPSKRTEHGDELVLSDRGFISRLITSTNSTIACDVSGIMTKRGVPIFYVIYKDGSIKVWTIEKENTSTTISLAKITPNARFSDADLSIRADCIKGQIVVTVVLKFVQFTEFYTFLDQDNKAMTLLASAVGRFEGSLVDYKLLFQDDNGIRLVGLWDPGDVTNRYILAYIELQSSEKSSSSFGWTTVDYSLQKRNDYKSMSVEQIKETIFDADTRSFEVAARAISLSCENSNMDVEDNDWKAIVNFAENYARFPDNPNKYKDKEKRRSLLSLEEESKDFEIKFFQEIAATCDQLEESARKPLSLMVVDIEGANFFGVISKDYFSIVHHREFEVDQGLINAINSLLEKIPKSCDAQGMKDYKRIVKKLENSVGEELLAKILTLIRQVTQGIELIAKEPAPSVSFPFRGQFTAGLVCAKLRENVKNYHEFISGVLKIREFITQSDIFAFEGYDVKLIQKCDLFRMGLEFIIKLFKIKMQTKYTAFTLGSWLFLANDISSIRIEGSAEPPPVTSKFHKMNYNWFLVNSTAAALQAVWPSNSALVVCRHLADQNKWNTLHEVCRMYSKEKYHPAAINYYLALSLSGSGHAEKALTAFHKCLDDFSNEEIALHKAMRSPGETLTPPVTIGEVYAQIIKFVNDQEQYEEVVTLSKNALHLLQDGDEYKTRINATLFNLLASRRNWEEALAIVKMNKDVETRKSSLVELVNRLLRGGHGKHLVSLHFGELEQQVENTLLGTARSQDIETNPHLFELLFSYYMKKFRFLKAAQIMLEYSYYLKQATQNQELLRRRRDVLAAAATVFELLPENERFAYFPQEQVILDEDEVVSSESMDTSEPDFNRIRTKVVTAIVDEKMVHTDWVIAKSRLAILEDGIQPPLQENEILKFLIMNKHYDEALDVCREFNLDTTALFTALTIDTIGLELSKFEEFPAWSQTNRRHVETSLYDNWAVLKGILSVARKLWPDDSRPYRAVITAILSHQSSIPCWLQNEYSSFDISDYTRCLVDYDQIEIAAECLTNHLKQETEKILKEEITIIPYTVINDILHISSPLENKDKILAPLKKALEVYLGRITSFEAAQSFDN